MTYSFEVKPFRPMTAKEARDYQRYMLESEKKQRCLVQQRNKTS